MLSRFVWLSKPCTHLRLISFSYCILSCVAAEMTNGRNDFHRAGVCAQIDSLKQKCVFSELQQEQRALEVEQRL